MAIISWYGASWYGSGGPVQEIDVYVDDRKRDERIKRYRKDREHLREAIRFAFDGPLPVREAIAPFVAADAPVEVESPIDFGALLVSAASLRTLADWHERIAREREIDDDDEEVILLT